MSQLTAKEMSQIQNIVTTLIEAIEHLHKQVKEKQYTQSLYTFSSIVEGYQVIEGLLFHFNDQLVDETIPKLNNHISLIAGCFETGDLLKVNEIIQFSFLPAIRKLASAITQINNSEEKDDIVIGVFHSFGNPKDFYPEPRTMALVNESIRQHTKLLFFTSNDVDFEKQEVEASIYENGEWKRIRSPFPHVINNVGAGKRSHTERKLRRILPFTSFHVGNKFTLPKRLLENRKFAELLVPFTMGLNKKQIHNFLEKNNKAVFKALGSNRGEDIYFVTKRGQRYAVTEHKNEQVYSREYFDRWLDDIILAEKGSYIVQRFILTRTKANEPYHFRAHVQKDGQGKWGLTHIYPRVGNKKSNLSNVVNEGRVDDFHEFMIREFDEKGPEYEADILRLSLEIAQHLDKLYGFAIDELGIDLAIDETGRYWMHEANNGPQTAFHEEKRAVNTIAYAKYIAENGIYYDETIKKSQMGAFQAKKSQLPYYDSQGNPVLGIMVGKFNEDEMTRAITNVALQSEMTVCVFSLKNIDYDQMLIKAHVFEEQKWSEKIIEYPDVILDRIQMRENDDTQYIYDELSEVPFINSWKQNLVKRTELFDLLRGNPATHDVAPTPVIIEKTRDITRVLEKSGKIIIERNSYEKNEHKTIKTLSNSKFEIMENNKTVVLNGIQLRNKLNKELTKNTYIVLEDTRLVFESKVISFKVDLIRIEPDNWSIIGFYAKDEQGDMKDKDAALTAIYGDEAKKLCNEIELTSLQIASCLYDQYEDSMAVLSMEMSVDKNQSLKLLKIEPYRIQPADLESFATGIVARAKSLI